MKSDHYSAQRIEDNLWRDHLANKAQRLNDSSACQQTHNWNILPDLKVLYVFMVGSEGNNVILQKKKKKLCSGVQILSYCGPQKNVYFLSNFNTPLCWYPTPMILQFIGQLRHRAYSARRQILGQWGNKATPLQQGSENLRWHIKK